MVGKLSKKREAIKEAEKLKKSKKDQDISCGKVFCYLKNNYSDKELR
ncbi:MAG: hypothetical protein MRERC_4c082 [Mycoplasmataceae bacterium RC_NB112A]|nr:MAG: hypothetical protein MRERC_4c082 [Mycoplasmataceae bacterium RC_NB112A]